MDSNTNVSPESAPTTAPRSIWAIIPNVFLSPVQAFSDFKIKPQILILLLLAIVIGGGTAMILAEENAMLQYDLMKGSTSLPQQALEQMRQDAQNPSMVTSGLAGAAIIVIFGLLMALIAWFFGKIVFGGEAGFKAVWGTELLGGLISLLGGLVKIPLVLAKGSAKVSLGLAALFPDKDFSSIVYSVLFYLDIFNVWAIIVTGIGYSIIFGISKGQGIACSAIAFFLLTFVMLALQAVGLGFAGVEVTFF